MIHPPEAVTILARALSGLPPSAYGKAVLLQMNAVSHWRDKARDILDRIGPLMDRDLSDAANLVCDVMEKMATVAIGGFSPAVHTAFCLIRARATPGKDE